MPIKYDPPAPFWDVPTNLKKVQSAKRWVDLLHDVTVQDVVLSAQENYVSVEHFKRYTTTGMAIDQGKTSNVNALAILGRETGRNISEVGTTKFRPPYRPVTMGAIAARSKGKLYSPCRKLPLHDWHKKHGAKMEDYGGWFRPAYYKKFDNENEQAAIRREVRAVRNAVGVLDYSPLGKIIIRGRDAAAFLNYFYANNVQNLKVGRARYGLALNEHGTVIDDGIFLRLADDYFMVTTTSGGASRFALWLEEWHQCQWPEMDVIITQVTTGWGTISLQGPKARDLLLKIKMDMNLSKDHFPHMTVQQGILSGIDVKILRTSFTGELGFEIYMPRSYMQDLWESLMTAGQGLGISAFGLEALMVMRTEKGFIHIGVDTDSTTIPNDVGFAAAVRNKKDDYIGKRSLFRPEALRSDREILVGLKAVGGKLLPMGGIIIANKNDSEKMEGRVTSSYVSPTLGYPVALGMLKKWGR